MRVKLRYSEILEPATTLGSLYTYIYRGNSVYDPNYTGSGGQPPFFDGWAGMYNSYVVLSSRLVAECMTSGSTTDFILNVVSPSFTTSPATDALSAASWRYATSASTIIFGNAVKKTLSSSMSTCQMFGVQPQAILVDDLYSALISANPASAQTWYWHVNVQNQTGTTTITGAIRISIEYDVKFFDPYQTNLSSTRLPMVIARPCDSSSAAAAQQPTTTPLPEGGESVSSKATACPCCAQAVLPDTTPSPPIYSRTLARVPGITAV